MWVFYVLRSEATRRYYIGHTCDLERRLREHNSGQTKATRGRAYQFPRMADRDEAVSVVLYVDPNLGVGFRAGNFMAKGSAEMFLGIDLRPICAISALNDKAAPSSTLRHRAGEDREHLGSGWTFRSR